MGASKETVADGGMMGDDDVTFERDALAELGPYRWVVWFAVFEAVVVVVGVLVEQVLGAPIIGGLFASFAVLIAITGGLGVVALVIYRLVLGRR